MRVLLLGKDGQLGWELLRALAPLGDVIALGRADLDLSYPQDIRGAVRAARPTVIVNAAAYTAVVVNDRSYTIRVRFPQQTRSSMEAIRNTLLVSSTGKIGTLGSLATVVDIPGQTEIRRENLQRDVTVTGRLEGRDLGGGMADVQKTVAGL